MLHEILRRSYGWILVFYIWGRSRNFFHMLRDQKKYTHLQFETAICRTTLNVKIGKFNGGRKLLIEQIPLRRLLLCCTCYAEWVISINRKIRTFFSQIKMKLVSFPDESYRGTKTSQISSNAEQQQPNGGRACLVEKQHNKGILMVQAHEISKIATGCHHLQFDCVHWERRTARWREFAQTDV